MELDKWYLWNKNVYIFSVLSLYYLYTFINACLVKKEKKQAGLGFFVLFCSCLQKKEYKSWSNVYRSHPKDSNFQTLLLVSSAIFKNGVVCFI